MSNEELRVGSEEVWSFARLVGPLIEEAEAIAAEFEALLWRTYRWRADVQRIQKQSDGAARWP